MRQLAARLVRNQLAQNTAALYGVQVVKKCCRLSLSLIWHGYLGRAGGALWPSLNLWQSSSFW